jgi:chloramphenicol-sensitive protein RarD
MKKSAFLVALAYALWGLFPIYFKMLNTVSPFQIMSHRMAWCFVFMLIIMALRGELPALMKTITWRTALIYLCAGGILSINWLTYVWAVNSGYILEASLGYFINPLVIVLLGVVFLKEKLRLTQWIPIGLAALAVGYITIQHGKLPWIALVLAFSFGIYSLIKKIAPLDALPGLTMETAMVFLPALGFLLFENFRGQGTFIHDGASISLLLAASGIVSGVPLMLFSAGAQKIPLTLVGMLQYISPTIQFFLGVFLYGEAFDQTRVVGFSIIWLALLIYSLEGWAVRRKALAAEPA